MLTPSITNVSLQKPAVSPVSRPQTATRSAIPARAEGNRSQKPGRYDTNECQTCKNRKYQDESNDAGVSFKGATKINPKAVASAVAGHEMEHVSRESARAKEEGKQVVSQDVKIQTSVCPECHKVYVAGGTTTTVTKPEKATQGLDGPAAQVGEFLDLLV